MCIHLCVWLCAGECRVYMVRGIGSPWSRLTWVLGLSVLWENPVRHWEATTSGLSACVHTHTHTLPAHAHAHVLWQIQTNHSVKEKIENSWVNGGMWKRNVCCIMCWKVRLSSCQFLGSCAGTSPSRHRLHRAPSMKHTPDDSTASFCHDSSRCQIGQKLACKG